MCSLETVDRGKIIKISIVQGVQIKKGHRHEGRCHQEHYRDVISCCSRRWRRTGRRCKELICFGHTHFLAGSCQHISDSMDRLYHRLPP